MRIRDAFIGQIANLILERPGRKQTVREWANALQTSGAAIEARAAAAADAARAANALRHITGIEAWGQSRLRVFLGAPLHMDEYESYAPSADFDLTAQVAAFAATRAATVALAQQLADAAIADTRTVVHNSFGPLTVGGWLAYLDSHATREASCIK